MTTLEIARGMVALGLSVIPIGRNKIPDGTALPQEADPRTGEMRPVWKPYQKRQPTAEELASWFGRSKSRGLALVAGKCYAPLVGYELVCLDVERLDTFEGWEHVVKAQRPELLERCVLVDTPKGGVHAWVLVDGKVGGNEKLASEPDPLKPLTDGRTKEPLKDQDGNPYYAAKTVAETRGEGGYALVPGCPPPCHPDGGDKYKFRTGRQWPQLGVISAEEYGFLKDMLRSFNAYVTPPRKPPKPRPAPVAGEGQLPGDWLEENGDWAEILGRAGWKEVFSRGEVTYWERPDQKRVGWSGTTGYCKSAKGEDLLYVFSSSAHPFAPQKAYGKFNASAILFHGGNHSAAAAEIANRMRGSGHNPGSFRGLAAKTRQIDASGSGPPSSAGPPASPGTAEGAAGAPDPWEQPLPLDQTFQADPFPLEVLPPELRDMVRRIADTMNNPPDYAAVPLLAIASGLIGSTCRVEIKAGYAEQACLYCCVVGLPGTVKTGAMRAVARPVSFETGRRLRNGQNQLHVKNTTVEALADVLAAVPRGVLLINDELTSWLKGMNQYKAGGQGNDRQFWLSCWSGDDILVNRKNQEDGPVSIRNPFVSLVGGIQPEVVNDFHVGANDGFMDRFLFCYPEELPAREENWVTFTKPNWQGWNEICRRLWTMDLVERDGELFPHTYPIPEDAKPVWAAWTREMADARNAPDFPRHLKGVWAKLGGYAARLALVIHLLRDASGEEVPPQALDAESIRRGITVARYFRSHASKIYGQLGCIDLADSRHVWGWLRDQKRPGGGPGLTSIDGLGPMFTRREVYRGLRKTFPTMDGIDRILGVLNRMGWIRFVADDPGHRGAVSLFECHPSILGVSPVSPARPPGG